MFKIIIINVLNLDSKLERLFFCIIIVTPLSNLSTLLIKILLEWSAKDLEILQVNNIVFRLKHTKFLVLRLIPRLSCSYYLKFQNSKLKIKIYNLKSKFEIQSQFEITSQNPKFKIYEYGHNNFEL